MKYIQSFAVTGSFEFPLDMLRYDNCFPATGEDSARIRSTFELPREKTTIHLKRYTSKKSDLPTMDRWSSFEWTVLTDSITERTL